MVAYRAEVDGLRALAVVPVILFHAGFKAFSGGFVGVDIFFVISGYLITGIIIGEIAAGRFSLVGFYERRMRRILPALFLVMLACLPFAWFWLLPHEIRDFSRSLIAVATYTSNFLFWQTSGYFDPSAQLQPLLHTWSLAVEEQYYVLFPLLLMILFRFRRHWLVPSVVALAVLSLGAAELGARLYPMADFFLLPTRMWELCLGALVSIGESGRDRGDRTGVMIELGGLGGLGLILYSIICFDEQISAPSLYTLVPDVGAALVIWCASSRTIAGKILGDRILTGIGVISYSAYLWHQPILAFARERLLDEMSSGLAIGLVALTFCLSYLSWRFVETPFRDKTRIGRRQVFVCSAIGSVFFIAVGLAGELTKGFENQFKYVTLYQGDLGHSEFFKYGEDRYARCTPESIAVDAPVWDGRSICIQSKSGSPVDIALIGDSHADHLFYGIADNLPAKNVALYYKSSNPFLSNPDFGRIYDHVLHASSIQTVILTANWVGRLKGIPHDTTLEKELLATVKALSDAGKSVYLLGDTPNFPFSPDRCKYLAVGFSRTACDIPRWQVLDYEKRYMDALRHVSAEVPNVRLLETRDLLCNDAVCSMVKDGTLFYRDVNHLNIPGSLYVGSKIVELLPKLRK